MDSSMTQEEYLKENPNATLKEWIEYNKEKEKAYDESIVDYREREYEYLNTLIGKCFLFYQKDSIDFTISKLSKVAYSECSKESVLYGEKIWVYPESVGYDELDDLDRDSIIKAYNTELYTEMSTYKFMVTTDCIELSEEEYLQIKNPVVGAIDSSNTLIDKIIKEAIK